MIDHDMAWAPGDLERLAQKVAETRSIVAGVYSKRCFGAGVAVRFEEPGEYPLGVDRLVRGSCTAAPTHTA